MSLAGTELDFKDLAGKVSSTLRVHVQPYLLPPQPSPNHTLLTTAHTIGASMSCFLHAARLQHTFSLKVMYCTVVGGADHQRCLPVRPHLLQLQGGTGGVGATCSAVLGKCNSALTTVCRKEAVVACH